MEVDEKRDTHNVIAMRLQNGELIWKINDSSFTNGNDSLMETITFINEDTIRYKYYYHENGKWKANRCKIDTE